MDRSRLNLLRLRAAFAREPLAIDESAVSEIVARVRGWDTADDLLVEPSAEVIDGYYAARGTGSRSGAVAVVPVHGPIAKRDSMMSMMLGGTSTSRLTATMRMLAADESVSTILLDVDSPGGIAAGLPELAAEIRRTRESKRVVAIVDDVAASAAYWIASQADSIVATPESRTGSVGVFVEHVDCSKAMEAEGLAITYIHAGKYKVEGNPYEPLSDEAEAHIQSIVDNVMGLFVADVAKGRGVTPAQVRSDFGEGRVLTAKDAKAVGMVDAIATYSETVARLAGGKSLGMRADLKWMSESTFQQVEAEHRDISGVLAQRAAAFEAQVLSKEAEEAEIVERGPLARTWGWRARSVTR